MRIKLFIICLVGLLSACSDLSDTNSNELKIDSRNAEQWCDAESDPPAIVFGFGGTDTQGNTLNPPYVNSLGQCCFSAAINRSYDGACWARVTSTEYDFVTGSGNSWNNSTQWVEVDPADPVEICVPMIGSHFAIELYSCGCDPLGADPCVPYGQHWMSCNTFEIPCK